MTMNCRSNLSDYCGICIKGSRIIPLDSTGEGSGASSENNSSESGEVNEMPPVDNNDDLPF